MSSGFLVTPDAHAERMNPDLLVSRISVQQGGVVRRDQALAAGLSGGQIERRVRDGRWIRVGKFGYRTIEMNDPSDRVRAAVAALPEAVVSHQAAAEAHAISLVANGVASVLVHSQTTHEFPGVVVHRCHDLASGHVTVMDGLATTTVSRTIVDLAAILTQRHLAAVVDELLAAQRTTVEQIHAVLDHVARRGKPGVRRLRRVLGARAPGPENGSAMERLGARILMAEGLPVPHFEFSIPWEADRRFDVAYPDQLLAIEWDSRRWHTQADAFVRDRERDRRAVLHGWRVLRFTWEDLTDQPLMVVESVRDALTLSV